MNFDDEVIHWKSPSRQEFGSVASGRGGIMKGFGPGAYGKVGGLALGLTRSVSATPGMGVGHESSHERSSRGSWGFPPDPPR